MVSGSSEVKNPPAGDAVRRHEFVPLGREDTLEKGNGNQLHILPGKSQSIGSQKSQT